MAGEAAVCVQVREELSFAITQPIAHPAMFEAMGLQSGTGVLLFGPPGARVGGGDRREGRWAAGQVGARLAAAPTV